MTEIIASSFYAISILYLIFTAKFSNAPFMERPMAYHTVSVTLQLLLAAVAIYSWYSKGLNLEWYVQVGCIFLLDIVARTSSRLREEKKLKVAVREPFDDGLGDSQF